MVAKPQKAIISDLNEVTVAVLQPPAVSAVLSNAVRLFFDIRNGIPQLHAELGAAA